MNQMTIVRAPDGHLYILSATAAPEKLSADESKKIKEILEDTGKVLGKAIDAAIPRLNKGGTHNLHISVPEVFMD